MGGLYTKTKIFHFPEKLASLARDNPLIRPPIHIRLKPTNVCNHNCHYCAYRVNELQLGQDMSTRDKIPIEKMREIISDIVDMGVQAVTFSGGGDPLCYPDLAESLRQLAASDVRFAALTNGSRLRGEVARLFAEYATWLRVSIDGWDDQSYCDYRGVRSGAFDEVLGNMAQFKTLGGECYLGVSIIADRTNASHIFELSARLKQTGIDSVKVSPCIVSNSGAENNHYHKPIFATVKQQTEQAIEKLTDEKFSIYDAYHSQLDSFAKSYTWCPYLQILPVIGADQNVYPCQDKAYNLDQGLIGSLAETDFKSFWSADKSKFFRINPSHHCNHHCVADAKNRLVLQYLDAEGPHLGFV